MKKTYIIIVTYNGMLWIQKCLESCQGYPVIVVDNSSTDKTVSFIKETFPDVKVLEQEKNLGFGQANNVGMSYALTQGAEYVFLLNQDAYLHKGCIETLIATQTQNPDFGILSPIHLNGKGSRLDQNFSNYLSYKNNPDFFSDFVLKKELQDIYDVPFVNAAGWLVSRSILETVGGFDPIFFHYGEDDNYCQRAIYHGFKIGVVPTAFLHHDREGRTRVGIHTLDPFLKLERRLKNKFGNINTDEEKEFSTLLRKKKRALIKSFLRLRFSELALLRQEIHITEKVMQEVAVSRKINIEKGMHYLENQGYK